jgi:hypothetical protein
MTPLINACRAVVTLSLVAGILLVARGGMGTLGANLSGGGALVINRATPTEALLMQDPLHGAAFVPLYESAAAARELALGVLLILFGFFLHALLRSNDERRVPVRVVEPEQAAADTSFPEDPMPFETRRGASGRQWYWMEIKI